MVVCVRLATSLFDPIQIPCMESAPWGLDNGPFLLALVLASGAFINPLQQALESVFKTEQQLDYLKTLIVTLGGALIGAAAIAFSVETFSVQMNFARMPYGLFISLVPIGGSSVPSPARFCWASALRRVP
jgi:hypothetical protein